jgi:hypothetical protein
MKPRMDAATAVPTNQVFVSTLTRGISLDEWLPKPIRLQPGAGGAA